MNAISVSAASLHHCNEHIIFESAFPPKKWKSALKFDLKGNALYKITDFQPIKITSPLDTIYLLLKSIANKLLLFTICV